MGGSVGSIMLTGHPDGLEKMGLKPKPPNMPPQTGEKVDEAAEEARRKEKERLRRLKAKNTTRFSGNIAQTLTARTAGASVNTTLGGNY